MCPFPVMITALKHWLQVIFLLDNHFKFSPMIVLLTLILSSHSVVGDSVRLYSFIFGGDAPQSMLKIHEEYHSCWYFCSLQLFSVWLESSKCTLENMIWCLWQPSRLALESSFAQSQSWRYCCPRNLKFELSPPLSTHTLHGLSWKTVHLGWRYVSDNVFCAKPNSLWCM